MAVLEGTSLEYLGPPPEAFAPLLVVLSCTFVADTRLLPQRLAAFRAQHPGVGVLYLFREPRSAVETAFPRLDLFGGSCVAVDPSNTAFDVLLGHTGQRLVPAFCLFGRTELLWGGDLVGLEFAALLLKRPP
uniref:Uncharacterized protein n=1 Tax=Spironucleus salmonicida TaxID=348837 RepID=V6LFP6_9EUKA|eukprot:EST43113.1 Hypothetical protein SS50377_17272 [Spironucleus salmonicida]